MPIFNITEKFYFLFLFFTVSFFLLCTGVSAAPDKPGAPYHVNSEAPAGYEKDRVIEFIWNQVPNALYYNIYISINNSIFNFTGTSSEGKFAITGHDRTKYAIKATGVDASDKEGPLSDSSPAITIDITLPEVTGHTPLNNAREVDIHDSVKVYFNENMNLASLFAAGTVKLYRANELVETELSFDNEDHILTVTPNQGLHHNMTYTLRIEKSALDYAGNSLSDILEFSFNTRLAAKLTIENLLAYPSPADSRGTTLSYTLNQHVDEVEIEIYHVGGKRVRRFDDAPTSQGFNQRFWDLVNDEGEPVPNGLYYVRAVAKSNQTGTYLSDKILQKMLVIR